MPTAWRGHAPYKSSRRTWPRRRTVEAMPPGRHDFPKICRVAQKKHLTSGRFSISIHLYPFTLSGRATRSQSVLSRYSALPPASFPLGPVGADQSARSRPGDWRAQFRSARSVSFVVESQEALLCLPSNLTLRREQPQDFCPRRVTKVFVAHRQRNS